MVKTVFSPEPPPFAYVVIDSRTYLEDTSDMCIADVPRLVIAVSIIIIGQPYSPNKEKRTRVPPDGFEKNIGI